MYPSNKTSIMEQETLPQLDTTSYVSTYEAEGLLEDLLPHPDDFELFRDLDLAPFSTPTPDMSGTIDPHLLTSSSTSMYTQDDFESLAEYSPAPLATPPSSDISATIDTSLLTSSASSLYSPEDTTGFLSVDAEQALLGINDDHQSLFSNTPLAILPTFTIPSPAHQPWPPSPPPPRIPPTSAPRSPDQPHPATPAPLPTTLGHPTPTHPLPCPFPTCTSRILFTRPCDLRKHYQRHSKHLACRHVGCAQASAPAFSTEKDRARHEASHDPQVGCEWAGCGRVFSRGDNMRDHVRRVHLGRRGRGRGKGRRGT